MSVVLGKDKFMSLVKIKCVFVHGWGMNQAIWQPVVDSLPDWIEPVCIDLPGHGTNVQSGFLTLSDLVEACAEMVNEPAYWVGWSLGGMVVSQLALDYPEKVKAIMLVANSPCFIYKEDWLYGMKAVVFDEFAASLENNFIETIQRFLSLQVQGSESGRQILRQLRKKILAMPPANVQALEAGLKLLKTVDIRDQLINLKMPVIWILGDKDALVKVSLAGVLQKYNSQIEIVVIEKAAHAPFLSHLDQFSEKLISSVKKVV